MADNYESPAPTRFATRDAIFAVSDRRFEDVYIPEWKMTVKVRSITAAERERFEQNSMNEKNGNRTLNFRNLRSRLVVLTACDEHERPLFQSDDITMLSGRSAAALQRIFDVAQRLAGMTQADVEDMVGNSETPDDSSDFD